MITKKEDLINTAVFCHKGELRELYLKKCEKFGVSWNHAGLDINKYSLLMVDENTELQGVICCNDDFYLDLKRLTLSDLKPRTRTEYEKVTESIFDLRDEFEGGELYCKHEHAREYTQITNTQTLAQALHGGFCYRKVEKEIDWRDEVSDFVIKNKITYSCNGHRHIIAMTDYTDEQFLELCRVALRANGEIE